MDSEELKLRLKNLGVKVLKLSELLPSNPGGWAIAKQITRSATSPGANYRAACLAKSHRDFINKLKMVEEELDETLYWLELMVDVGYVSRESAIVPYRECRELLKIIIASLRTLRDNEVEA